MSRSTRYSIEETYSSYSTR